MEVWKIIAITLIPLLVGSIVWDMYKANSSSKSENVEEERKPLVERHKDISLKYWFDADAKEGMKPYESAMAVLSYMGHEKIEMEVGKRPTEIIRHYNWDLLYSWQHFSMTKIKIDYSKLKQHHRINHFPGITSVTNIDFLGTTIQSPYIPRIFTNHQDIDEYLKENPKTKFIEKSSSNSSHVRYVAEPKNIDFDDGKNFAQVLIENPLLVDGNAFDFGVYVVLTSVNPMRAYYYIGNVLLRVADLEFIADDFSNPRTFVMNKDDQLGVEFKVFEQYRQKKYTEMDILKVVLKERDIDPSAVFEHVENCINSVLMSQENIISAAVQDTNAKFGKENFFEILRFDFYLDENAQLYLSEAVLSPPLHGSADIGSADPGKAVYRSVLYNTFNLIGIGSYLKTHKVRDLGKYYVEFLANDNQINVNPEICINDPCTKSCDKIECRVCSRCIDAEFHHGLKLAYLEHLNMGDLKRVVPRPTVS